MLSRNKELKLTIGLKISTIKSSHKEKIDALNQKYNYTVDKFFEKYHVVKILEDFGSQYKYEEIHVDNFNLEEQESLIRKNAVKLFE